MLEALSNERTNYDEFLARSRQLVIGTCVGIGQRHIGIADNLYDWVIVDEAARSISVNWRLPCSLAHVFCL